MSDGGKGSGRRPNEVPDEVVKNNWSTIFGESPLERKKRLEKEAKEFDEKVVMKEEYYDLE